MIDTIAQWAMKLLGNFASSNPIVHLVLTVLAILVVAAQAIVAVTPSTADDVWWNKLKATPYIGPFMVWITNFAPFHKD